MNPEARRVFVSSATRYGGGGGGNFKCNYLQVYCNIIFACSFHKTDLQGIFVTAFPLPPFALQLIYVDVFFSGFLVSLRGLLLTVKRNTVR